MSICREKEDRFWRKAQTKWENEIKEYSEWDTFDRYDFKEENEWTVADWEQSPLNQIIWCKLLAEGLGKLKKVSLNYSVNRYYSMIEMEEMGDIRILFDVMNNPKYLSVEMEDYHRIGNFAPIPGKTLERSLQLIHKGKGERWDLFLKYMRTNWAGINDWGISFEEYMQISFQQMYFEKGFELLSLNKPLNVVDGLIREGLAGDIITINPAQVEKLIEIRGRIVSQHIADLLSVSQQ